MEKRKKLDTDPETQLRLLYNKDYKKTSIIFSYKLLVKVFVTNSFKITYSYFTMIFHNSCPPCQKLAKGFFLFFKFFFANNFNHIK